MTLAPDTIMTMILLVLAAVFFGLSIKPHLQNMNGVAAGLFCFALLLILQNLL